MTFYFFILPPLESSQVESILYSGGITNYTRYTCYFILFFVSEMGSVIFLPGAQLIRGCFSIVYSVNTNNSAYSDFIIDQELNIAIQLRKIAKYVKKTTNYFKFI